MATSTPLSTVLVLDFGAQYGQLIARRVRDLNVYSEIVPCDISADEVREKNPDAIILSGGPASVYAEDAPSVDPEIFELGIPVLGFCYGQQIMAKTLGGTVSHTEKGEYGPAPLTRVDGVDSSVVAALCAKAIGKQLVCVFVNHGLLRKNEPEEVEEVFTKQFDVDFIHVHAEDRYAQLLAGVTDPEAKRRIIGEQFWKEFFAVAEEVAGDGEPVKFLAQGTIYPDIIESGARKTGGKASTIKSHHNLIPFPDGVHFDLIEPLDHFFKDEVRALGSALGLPDHIVHRQPFPGPGLAIRIIGEVTPEKLEILKNADAIVREELDAYNEQLFERSGERNGEVARESAGGPEVERSVWQYFAVLPDVRSVGVMGDERTYQHPIILRAVESSDAMTADWAKLPYDVLARISSRIVAEVPGINRVAYDITSKPPATIEWE